MRSSASRSFRPSRAALWLLGRTVHPESQYSALGDIEEIARILAEQKGGFKAKLWMWFQVIRSFPAHIRDSIRWRFAMFRNYIKIALRTLKRQRFYTSINVAGFAIGLAVVLLIALYVSHEWSADRFHVRYDSIYRLQRKDSPQMAGPIAELIREELPNVQIVRTETFRTRKADIRYMDKLFQIKDVIFAEEGFLDLFSFPLLEGDPKDLSVPMVVYLTESEANRIFGSENPQGKTLLIDGQHEMRVAGILKDVPLNSSIQFSGIASFSSLTNILDPAFLSGFMAWNYENYVLLPEGMEKAQAEKAINEVLHPKLPSWAQNLTFELFPFGSIHFDTSMRDYCRHGNLRTLMILSGVGILILIIAVLNFINLSIAQAAIRAREVGVRKVVGSSKKQLIRQFLCESILLCLFSVLLAVGLASLALPRFNALTGMRFASLPVTSALHWIVLLAGAVLLGITAGLYPAFYLTLFNPGTVLRGEVNLGVHKARFRKGMIVIQFIISSVIIMVTLLMGNQLDYLLNKDLGFQKERILFIKTSPEVESNVGIFIDRLRQHPNVTTAAQTAYIPGGEDPMQWTTNMETLGETKQITYSAVPMDDQFLNLMGIPVVQGRPVDGNLKTDIQKVCLINETAVKMFELEDPLQAKISGMQVIGVVRDFYYESLHHPVKPLVFLYWPDFYSYIAVKVNTDDRQSLRQTIEDIRSIWKGVSPNFIMDLRFLDAEIERYYQQDLLFRRTFGYFSILAVIVASLGLLGLVAYMAHRRIREIGIRKVLGASSSDIVWLMGREFLALVAIASVLAVPPAWLFIQNWLNDFSIRTPVSPWLFFAGAGICLAVAMGTVLIQSLNAAHNDPVESLRHE